MRTGNIFQIPETKADYKELWEDSSEFINCVDEMLFDISSTLELYDIGEEDIRLSSVHNVHEMDETERSSFAGDMDTVFIDTELLAVPDKRNKGIWRIYVLRDSWDY